MRYIWRVITASARARAITVSLVCADITALLLAIAVAFALRFEGQSAATIYADHVRPLRTCVPAAIAIYLAAFVYLRLYRREWRFAGLEVLWRIVLANTIGITAFAAYQYVLGMGFPRSVMILMWVCGTVSTGGIRIALRAVCVARHRGAVSPAAAASRIQPRRVVILGAGALGARILQAAREDPSLAGYEIVGFLDDDPGKRGVYVGSELVLGPIDTLPELLHRRAIDEVIVALPEDALSRLREYVLECRRLQLPVRKVPYIRDMLLPGNAIPLTDFSVEDLLRRPQADDNTAEIAAYIKGKRVLVTGAGGSIGSELCRQIARQTPASLILLGHGENSIHTIHQELLADYPETAARSHCVIANVSNRKRTAQVFGQYAPQVVFHTAAHKHVPMMESNCQEAVANNVIGTDSVVRACGRCGVERMVMISTDKAADPCSVMGATKWLCEEVVRTGADTWQHTAFITIRFGNVLGSRGSVVPMFREQIRRGGPVTVTHPEMTRYFMTIPEAVRLVVEAGAVGESGRLYLLDMGEPVRVLDLARDMICFSGLRPDIDILIEFTGTRPGERLHERLVSADERMEESQWPGLLNVRRGVHFTAKEMDHALCRLESITDAADEAELRVCLQELVPSFCTEPADTVESPGRRATQAMATDR